MAGECLSLHTRILRYVGFLRWRGGQRGERLGGPPGRTYAARAHAVYRLLMLGLTSFYMVQECVYAYQQRHNMDNLSRVLFLFFCHITSVVKQIVFYYDADRIDQMINSFDEAALNPSAGSARLARTARRARRVVRVYAGTAVVTCSLWLLFHALHRIVHGEADFPFWTGIDNNPPFVFAAVLLYSFYGTTLVGIANTTMDAFMATVLYVCQTELTILRESFESLPDQAKAQSMKSGEDYEIILMKLLFKYYQHYQKVYDVANLFEDIFGGAILVQFAVGGWILCMAAYKIVSLDILSLEFTSMVLFISCILTELFLYCYYGNELQVESEQLPQSVYATRWEDAPAPFRRCLLLLLLRVSRPLCPSAARLLPLSLRTYVKILKSSYSFYAVLRQTKQN